MKTIAIVVLSGLIAACATQPRAPVVAARAEPSAEVKPKGTVAASAPVGTSAATAPVADHSAESTEVINQSYLKRGYRAVHRNGQLQYCRSEVITGTLFRSTLCLTDAQMKAAEQDRQNVLDQFGKQEGVDCSVFKCN